MPRVHVYLPTHLYNRRHELPLSITLSGLLASGLEQALNDGQKVGPVKGKKAS